MNAAQSPNHSPLLTLFKEQLEAECSKLRQEYDLSKRGDLLVYWYFTCLLDLSDADVVGIVCDGFGDLGIDAIWIDDETFVHFYSFKNPMQAIKGFAGGDVDKMISGLRLILDRKHDQVANKELTARLADVYQQIPRGYRIHFVTSGSGLSQESIVKLNAFVAELSGPAKDMFAWVEEPLGTLQQRYYQQTLPSVEDSLRFDLDAAPYILSAGAADSYFFHVNGLRLAELYKTHGEGLLQRNIRIDQGETSTNRSIETACTGPHAANFLHFNNGVTFLCKQAKYDAIHRVLVLENAQVVNGGQTIRAISRANNGGTLDSAVLVAARAVTSSGNHDFANNVAVNQNNQNRLGTGFLRSNDQRVVQLAHALSARGYYLERREGELKTLSEEEKGKICEQIGKQSLPGNTIRLKEGAQAYTATFLQQPEVAKKDPRKIFLSLEDSGQFETIFSADMTAEKVIVAHRIKNCVDDLVRRFARIRRRLQERDDVQQAYTPVIGGQLAAYRDIHQVIPQCSLFVCGVLYRDLVGIREKSFSSIPGILERVGDELLQEYLGLVVKYARENEDRADRSWPTLLKSNAFFGFVTSYLVDVRESESRDEQA